MDIATQKTALETRRKELAGHLLEVEHELDETPTKDLEDYSTERQGDEVLESLGHVELAELERIDAALVRIEQDTYGVCVSCDEPISDARLALLPDTPFCKRCAK